jgi:hypothetical protein
MIKANDAQTNALAPARAERMDVCAATLMSTAKSTWLEAEVKSQLLVLGVANSRARIMKELFDEIKSDAGLRNFDVPRRI